MRQSTASPSENASGIETSQKRAKAHQRMELAEGNNRAERTGKRIRRAAGCVRRAAGCVRCAE